jgi:hypothetical protein
MREDPRPTTREDGEEGLSRPPRIPLRVRIEPLDPEPRLLDRIASEVATFPRVREFLGDSQPRLLSLDLVDPEPEVKRGNGWPGATHYRATLYDYASHRTIIAEGPLSRPELAAVRESARPPRPTPAEFVDAVRLLRADEEAGRGLRDGELRAYRPMPPMALHQLPDGRFERVVNVGIRSEGGDRNEILGVDLASRSVLRFEDGAPWRALAHRSACGLPDAGQGTVSSAPGRVRVTVTQGGQVLWEFVAIRPAASSGTNGSGIELRHVSYRGKRVLYRAHVPILNVKYDRDACGPYRDWQNEEGRLQAVGRDIGNTGFRLCSAPAQTILQSGSDAGGFLGVAVYVQGQEVVLVSEMEAGWYRYVSEWRLHADGTIRPRFGFAGVQNSCICNVHHHHAYWRLDFDIRTAGNNRVREFNDPPLGRSRWHTKNFEIRRPRDPGRKRFWRVENTVTGEAYDIIPGPSDGVATAAPDWPFGVGDVWVLRYHGAEVDDGVHAVGPPYEAGLNAWVDGEAVHNHDVVVWYAGHFTHDVAGEEPGHFGHVVGPTLRPANW